MATPAVILNSGPIGFPLLLTPNGVDDTSQIQAALNKGNIALQSGAIYQISNTLLIKNAAILGNGSGLLWNADPDLQNVPTILKWIGASNNIPAIKIQGSTSVSSETDSWCILRDFKLLYSGNSAGTDGIYMDGENGLVRHIFLDDINVEKFSGVGIHAKGTTFDVHYHRTGIVNSIDDNLRVEFGTPFTGGPSQHYFLGLTSLANAAGKYAANVSVAFDAVFTGGTIGSTTGAHGIRLAGSGSNVLYGASIIGLNIEGSGGGGNGVTYDIGAGLQILAGNIENWTNGLVIGTAASANVAKNWYLDAGMNLNTAGVLINTGGPRSGIIGPRANHQVGTALAITNNRNTSDGVYNELMRQFNTPDIPAQSAMTVPASGSPYTNKDGYRELVMVTTLNNLSAVSYKGQTGSALVGIPFLLEPGDQITYTYTPTAPVVRIIPIGE